MSGDIQWDPPEILAQRNRQILAGRGNWPAGALEVCEEIERRFPAWRVWWVQENTYRGFERPAGFRAVREGLCYRHEVFAPHADALAEEILQAPEPPEVFGRLLSLVRPPSE